jgi:hypothetical protein
MNQFRLLILKQVFLKKSVSLQTAFAAETRLAEGQWLEEPVDMLKLWMFRVGTRRPTVSRTEGHHLVSLKAFTNLLRRNHQSDNACYAVSVNVIFPINYLSDIPYLGKNILWKRAANFPWICSSLLESVIIPSNRSIFEFRSDLNII